MAATGSISTHSVEDAQHKAIRQAYRLLHTGFIILPIITGLDKFTNLLTDWSQYLSPLVTQILPVSAHTFMYGIGVVEIIAGLVVLLKPRYGGYLVAVWLWGIILNMLLIPGFYDVALRDFGLSLAALALARLSTVIPQE